MRVLFATDGSAGALAAGRFLAGLSHRPDIYVHIMTVVDPRSLPDAGHATLCAAQAVLGGFPAWVTTDVEYAHSTDRIVEGILDAADTIEADMIVIGASGHSSLARFCLGSVAESVGRHATRSILMVRPSEDPLQEVVIGIDGSIDARQAASFAACAIPLPENCQLRLVRAVPQPTWIAIPDASPVGGIRGISQQMADIVASEYEGAGRSLTAFAEELGDGTHPVQTQVRYGDPGTELIHAVEEYNAGLLVVGSEGLTALSRLLLGSVSEWVLRHAPCSVLVVKHPRVTEISADEIGTLADSLATSAA